MSNDSLFDYLTHYKIEVKLKKLMILYQAENKPLDTKYWQIEKTFTKDYNVKQVDQECKNKIQIIIKKLKAVLGIYQKKPEEMIELILRKSLSEYNASMTSFDMISFSSKEQIHKIGLKDEKNS